MEFVFLSRFWGKERKEGRKEVEFSILRSAIASTSHLKIKLSNQFREIEIFKNKVQMDRGSAIS